MKKSMILGILLISMALLGAQDTDPFQNLIHSAVCADGNLRVRWDDATGAAVPTECHFSVNGGSWSQAEVQNLTATQLQALVPYTYGQTLRYRLRAEMMVMTETGVVMQAPYLGGDVFPQQLASYGLIGTDATGDSITVYAPTLDLTNTWCGATQDKIYSALGNVANSFPTFNSLTSFNIYMTTIINPESAADTLAYAMIYSFNIQNVISPGLYKVRLDPTGIPLFQRIGNIQAMVVGGKLQMACNIADLAADPDFGAWPNAYNALVFASATLRLSYDPNTQLTEFGFGDYSTPGLVIFRENLYEVAQNSLPEHSNLGLDEFTTTLFFDYFDADGDFPLVAEFVLDGQAYPLYPSSYDFSQPVTFWGGLPYLPLTGLLRLSDNEMDFVEYVFGEVSNPENPPAPPELACRMPNPWRSGSARIEISGLGSKQFSVGVFNLRGQKLGSLWQGSTPGGSLELQWDGTLNGEALGNGLYFLRLEQGERALTRRFILAK